MSRTYRRKEMNALHHIYKEDEVCPWNHQEVRWKGVFRDGSNYHKYKSKAIAVFYSDKSRHNHFWEHPLPRWVRNKLQERPFRYDSKLKINKAVVFEELETLSIKRPKKDIWLYW